MTGRARSVPILIVALALGGCASTRGTIGGWFGAATPTPVSTPGTAAQAPRVYYAGVEGMQVYSDSSASSKVVGELSLHEKVTRTRLERGFAFVQSAKSGTKGWVKNAQLIWRLPTAPTTAAPAAEEPQPAEPEEPEAPAVEEPPAPTAPAVEEPAAPEAPEAAAPATELPPASTPVPAAPPRAKQTPRGLAPSIFDAY